MATAVTFDPAVRRTYLGGSDIGAILGVDKYRSPLDVYLEKRGLVEGFAGNAHTKRGNRLEDIAAQEFMEKRGVQLRRSNVELVHMRHDFLRGHVDRRIVGERAIAEIKCPSVAAFRKHQREGLPESYIAQLQWYLGLAAMDRGTWILFCADQWDTLDFPVPFDRDTYEGMVERAVAFWNNHILPGIPPVAGKDEGEKLELTIAAEGTRQVTRRDDPEMLAAINDLYEAKRLKADGAELEDMAKERVKALIGDKLGTYEGPGFRLSYSESAGRKNGYDDKAIVAHALDREKVIEIVGALYQGEDLPKVLDAARLDISRFQKYAKGSRTLRPTFYGVE